MGNCPSGLDMELVSGETLHTTFRDMQSALKNSHVTNGNNNVSRRSRGSRSLSPFGTKVSGISNKLSYVERVVLEIIETERKYVQDLRSIAEVCNCPFTLALWEILYFCLMRSDSLSSELFLWVDLGRVGQSTARFLILIVNLTFLNFKCSLNSQGLAVSLTGFSYEELIPGWI